jgi:hypothetical protein
MSDILNINDILVELKNIDIFFFIKKLPDNIKKYIYYEFFETKIYFNEFNILLNNRLSKKLNISLIRPHIPIILSKPKLISYFCTNILGYKNHKTFETVYIQHKIQNNKSFVNMTNGDSFALALLMYLYH